METSAGSKSVVQLDVAVKPNPVVGKIDAKVFPFTCIQTETELLSDPTSATVYPTVLVIATAKIPVDDLVTPVTTPVYVALLIDPPAAEKIAVPTTPAPGAPVAPVAPVAPAGPLDAK